MEELRESKNPLPISVLTDYISKSWAEVGNIKSDIEGFKAAFKGTEKIEETLQALVDSYLIAIGQLEAYAEAKDYVEFPETEDKSLKEDICIDIDVKNYDKDAKTEVKIKPNKEECSDEECEKDKKAEAISEPFEYFTDFDEPEAISDEDKIDLQEAFNLFK